MKFEKLNEDYEDNKSNQNGLYIKDNVLIKADENIKEAIIPNSVTSIGYGAFEDCETLTDIYYIGTEEEWNRN